MASKMIGIEIGSDTLKLAVVSGGYVKTMYVEFDNWLREFAEKTPNCTYLTLSTYTPIHRNDIYVEDHVHFNQEGYKIYAEFFKEALKEELDQY